MSESILKKQSLRLVSYRWFILIMPVFWICAVATRIAQNVQKKAGRLASNMGTINIYHIVLKSKLNALISWEMTKKARISIVNAIICARSSNTRKDWKLPKRKQKNIWAWNLKLKELHRPPGNASYNCIPDSSGSSGCSVSVTPV